MSRLRGRELRRTSRNWERLAAADPFWAALSDDGKLGAWDVQEFLESGEAHVTWILAYVSELGVPVRRDRALDFGCGPGRFTGALADAFADVDAVDVSDSMIEKARRLHGDRVHFHVNTRPDLALFEDGRFDFILTYLVLQHIPAPLALEYIGEFVRVLAPGGVAAFQAPDALLAPRGLFDPRILGTRMRNLASRAKAILQRRPVMEMHMIPVGDVEAAVTTAGGEIVEIAEDWSGGDFCRSIRYVVRRPEQAPKNAP